jgi:hypothetical protein
MKTTMKKLKALALILVMLLALSTTAFATVNPDPASLTDGEVGVFTAKDTPTSQSKTLVLEKEIRVYNVDEQTVKAPTISYAYTIAPAAVAEGTTVTDSDKNGTIHESGVSVKVPVKPGVGTPTIANAGVVTWTAAEDVNAGTDGVKNTKGISIDFSSVVFTGAGIYRYAITEGLSSGYTYSASGVTETTAPAAGAHTRYVDVYVRPATSGYTDGTTAAQWDIYGYTCFCNNVSITESNKTTAAVKTTGFVDGTSDGSTAFLADQYYTFNVTISKTVVNDGFGAATVDFPFTVLFTNDTVSAGTIVTNGATAPTGTDFTHSSSVDLTTGDLKGIATLKSGQQIKYVGIPNGTAVEVYETNVATGVTYTVSTSVDSGTPTVDNSVSWGSVPSAAVTQASPKPAYESTKATFTTAADVDDDTAHTVAVTNTLLTISPTGLVLRYGPFALILALGVVILLVSRRRREEEN